MRPRSRNRPGCLARTCGSVISFRLASTITWPFRVTFTLRPSQVISSAFHSPVGFNAPRRADVVDGSAILGGAQAGVLRGAVVEDLDFHSFVSNRAATQRSPDSDAIVRTGLELELQPQDEIRIIFFRKQVAATAARAVQH